MKKPIFIAELTINHLGMVKIAKAMIKAAKLAGADYAKLKMKKVRKYYKVDVQKWREFDFLDYRHSLELSEDDFLELSNYCKEIDFPWFTTIHDEETRDFVTKFDPPFYKIASMDADKEDFVNSTIQICKEDKKPLIISMGGKTDAFAESIVGRINEAGIDAYILHTVSVYPTPEGQSNINYIPHLIKKYGSDRIKIGYSGHEEGIAPSVLASIYGAEMIERHFTLTRDYNIHHIKAAITPEEYTSMTSLITQINKEKNAHMIEMRKEELEFLKEVKYA